MNLERYSDCIDLLRSVIDKSLSNSNKDDAKSNPQILYLLAGILNEKNDEECVSLYERVIKINPKFYLAYRGLGNYYLKNKNYLLSKENYAKAIEINPQRYGSIYKNLGIVLLELGDNSGARESFKTYLRFIPNAKDKDNILQFLNS